MIQALRATKDIRSNMPLWRAGEESPEDMKLNQLQCTLCVCVCIPLWIGRQGGFHGVEGVHRMNGGIIRVPPTVLERQP